MDANVIKFFYLTTDAQANYFEKNINLLAPELFLLILAHTVYKMWIIQVPNKLEFWNKLHFKGKKNWEYTPCLKYSVSIFVE